MGQPVAVAVGCAKLAGSSSPPSTTISASAGTPECVRHNIVHHGRQNVGNQRWQHFVDRLRQLPGSARMLVCWRSPSEPSPRQRGIRRACHTLPLPLLAGSSSPPSTTISASAGTPECVRHNIVHHGRQNVGNQRWQHFVDRLRQLPGSARMLVCRRSPSEPSPRQRGIRRACHTLPLPLLAGSSSPPSTTISASAGTPECVRHNIVHLRRQNVGNQRWQHFVDRLRQLPGSARMLVCRRSPSEPSPRQRGIRRACHTLPLLRRLSIVAGRAC